MIHSELIFVKAIAPVSRFLILHADVQLFKYHLLKYNVLALCQRLFDYIYGNLCLGSLFCFISLSFFFFLILQDCHDYYSDIIIIEVRSISPPTLLFFFNIVLAMLRLLPPYQNGQNPEY